MAHIIASENLLAFDTSTSRMSVALTMQGVLYTASECQVQEHARALLPMIEQLMRVANTHFSALHGIVFGQGPGSFTGLRIACSVAKGLAYAHDLPVYPVSSLAAIAYDVYQHEHQVANTTVLAMMDARMHQVYWAMYDKLDEVMPAQVSKASDVIIEPGRSCVVAGVGLEDYIS